MSINHIFIRNKKNFEKIKKILPNVLTSRQYYAIIVNCIIIAQNVHLSATYIWQTRKKFVEKHPRYPYSFGPCPLWHDYYIEWSD